MLIKKMIICVLSFPLFAGCLMESSETRYSSFKESEAVQERAVESFNAIELDGDFIVFIQNGEQEKLEVKGSDQNLESILIDVDNEVLRIGHLREYRSGRRGQPVSLSITLPKLTRLKGTQNIRLNTPYEFIFDSLYLNFAGAATLNLNLKGNYLYGVFAGASDINMSGEVGEMFVNMPGAGKLKAFDLINKKVDISIAGAGKAEVHVTEELRVNIAGACTVEYKGTPDNVFSNISGIGRIRQVD